MRTDVASTLAALCLFILAPTSHARADEPAPRLVLGARTLVLTQGTTARIYTADGQPVARIGGPDDDSRGRRQSSAGATADRVFDLYGVSEGLRDTQSGEDFLEDDLTLDERRAQRDARGAGPTPLPTGPARAAVDRDGVWLAAAGAIWRITDGRPPERRGPAPARLRALAAIDEASLLLARDDELLASHDGGVTFTILERAAAPIDALAVSPTGRWVAFASAGDVSLVSPQAGGQRQALSTSARVRDLAACGETLVVLAGDEVLVGEEGGPLVRASAGVSARGIACSRSGAGPWVAAGPDLLVSRDRGRTFRRRIDQPEAGALAAAVSLDGIWLYVPHHGLAPLPLEEGLPAPPPAAPEPTALTRVPPRWGEFLPRLTLLAAYAEVGQRHDLRALALAEIPLGRQRGVRTIGPRPMLAQWAPPASAPEVTPNSGWPASQTPQVAPARADPDRTCLALARDRAVERAVADPDLARSLVTRAGRSAWLPELRVRVERRLGRTESLDVKPTVAGDALGLDSANDVRYEVRATWDLPRLVFNPEEVAAAQQALRMADTRREIESQVNRLYFERRRLLLAASGSPGEDAQRLVQLEELDAEIDAASGDAFSSCRRHGLQGFAP